VGTRFVFPEAPLRLGPEYAGGRAWWWIDVEARVRRQAAGVFDVSEVPDGLAPAQAKTEAAISALVAELAPPPGKIVLGGFSQGAMLSLDVALRSSLPLAGLLLMSGTHLAATEWAAKMPARRGLPLFMSHGRGDPLLPFVVSERLRDTLVSAGMPVDWVDFHEGHTITPVVVERASAFLQRVLA
jgi:phospholipase/carboxylesterase